MAAKKKATGKSGARVELDARKLMADRLETVVRLCVCGPGRDQLLGLCVFAGMGFEKELGAVQKTLLQHRVISRDTLHEEMGRCRQQARVA